MSTIHKVINVTEKHDEKIESLKREISDYEKELMFLRVKNEYNPGKKIFWGVLEVFGWIAVGIAVLISLISIEAYNGNGDMFTFITIVIVTPIILLTLVFRHFKSIYTVKEESLKILEEKIFILKRDLEKVNEEKRMCINFSQERVISNEKREEKECPMCAELVKVRAKVCRFCGHKFDEYL